MKDSAHLESFLDMTRAEKGASPNTVSAYTRDLNDFHAFLTAKNLSFTLVTSKDITSYITSLENAELSAKTCCRRLSAIREFYRFLFSENRIRENPSDNIDSSKIGKSLPKYLTEDEVNRLLSAARTLTGKNHPKTVAIVEILYATGMRVSELCALPLAGVLNGEHSITIMGKGSKERLVPLNPYAIEAIKKWILLRDQELKRDSKWLFPARSKSGHITRSACFNILKNLAVKAEISPAKVSPHVLRHSFASHLIAHDADLRSVGTMLGHSDIATTEIYTHIQPDRLQKLVTSAHPLTRLKIPKS